MRNKEAFISDFNQVVKKEYQENAVEDAAHTLNHANDGVYALEKEFTTTNQKEKFYFEKRKRPKTDYPNESIDDWFYLGRGQS